jgi:hypothetical protein
MNPKWLSPAHVLGAALLAVPAVARADGVPPAAATPLQREQAQSRFLRGKELMDRGQYSEALVEFRASHDIVSSPNTRLEIARDLRASGQLVAAYAEYGRAAVEAKEVASEDDRYRRAYEAASAERAELEPRLAFVSLTVSHPREETRVSIGDEELRRAAWEEPAPLAAGSTAIVVTTPGYRPLTRTIQVAAGDHVTVVIDAQEAPAESAVATVAPEEPPPVAPPPQRDGARGALRASAYVAAGVGVAGLATFAVGGLLARSAYDDLQKSCGGGPCAANKKSEVDRGRTEQTIANVGLVAGLVGVAAGVTLFVVSLPKSAPTQSVAVVGVPGGLGLRGAFR